MSLSVTESRSDSSLIPLSRFLIMAATPSFNSSAFRAFAAVYAACPNFTASLLDARTRYLGGCTSLNGFRSAKQVAPPVSIKARLSRVGAVPEDEADRGFVVKGPTGCLGCAIGGVGEATVGGDSEQEGKILERGGGRTGRLGMITGAGLPGEGLITAGEVE